MLPEPAQLYACPHCGKKKAMFSMLSGNTFAATLWSDGRSIYPMHPTISLIQKCDSCNSYSLFSEWEERGCEKDNYDGITGKLTYEDTKAAFTSLTETGRYDSDDVLAISLEYIRSYNDKFNQSDDSPEENAQRYDSSILEWIDVAYNNSDISMLDLDERYSMGYTLRTLSAALW